MNGSCYVIRDFCYDILAFLCANKKCILHEALCMKILLVNYAQSADWPGAGYVPGGPF